MCNEVLSWYWYQFKGTWIVTGSLNHYYYEEMKTHCYILPVSAVVHVCWEEVGHTRSNHSSKMSLSVKLTCLS